jgi:3-hydroxybutyryl-CoA dehydratase
MNVLGGYDIEDLSIGMSATFSKIITEADIVMFAGVSGDNNALHINQEYAETTAFGGCIAHGMLTASIISAAVANELPGPGAIYMSQNLIFRGPVRPGDTVHATVTVRQIIAGRNHVTLQTTCTVDGRTVIEGEALVKVGARLPAVSHLTVEESRAAALIS